MRRPLTVEFTVIVRRALELPFDKPQLFCRAPRRLRIEHAIVAHNALETVGVAKNPICHVTAVTRTQRTLPVFVDEGIVLLDVIEAFHQILKRSAAPVSVDGIGKVLSVAGGAVKVNHNHYIAAGGEELGIPAEAPVVAPGPLRASVDEKLHGIFPAGVKVRRLEQSPFDLFPMGTLEPEGVGIRHADPRKQAVIHMGYRPCLIERTCLGSAIPVSCLGTTPLAERVGSIDLIRCDAGHAGEDQSLTVGGNRWIIIVPTYNGAPEDFRLRRRAAGCRTGLNGIDEAM